MEARETFEDVAELYGEVRQGYPAALFDALAAAVAAAEGGEISLGWETHLYAARRR